MKAYEYCKESNIMEAQRGRKDDGRNHTGVKLATMTGKLQSLIIGYQAGKYFFIRSGSKTVVKDYDSETVQEVMKETGKKVGDKITFKSLSTSVKLNTYCQEHRKCKGSICEKCFSEAALSGDDSKSAGMRRNLEHNHNRLAWNVLNYADLPIITTDYFRFESHGDLNSVFQVLNYLMICEKALANGSKTRFALWTKNPEILDKVFNVYHIEKPANLTIQISSLYVDVECNKGLDRWYADRVFTVLSTPEVADNLDVKFNCCSPDRKHTYCIGCRNCYKTVSENGVDRVFEMLREK